MLDGWMDEGTTGHRICTASGSWRREANGFSLEPPEEGSLAYILMLAQ